MRPCRRGSRLINIDARYSEQADTPEQARAGSLSPPLCFDLAHEAREICFQRLGDAV